ncbi:DUF1501 domain-containing protein [Nocardioides iriomotensis]|uniref:DUF1501 domain-containing protein n=1 Tax=Nocardioides iriomotensis TaxID=715784 RepID=A0A4Q5IZA9_9ACTN|nr:DUF1501 domain-containing protein [Nocardioides iriomotensis]RYU10618.1 DUF1501 domain-containing protein [Nocardioides iriomotensis]
MDPETTASCCEEFERAAGPSRRRVLAGLAAATGAAVTTSVFGDAFRQVSFAAPSRRAVGNNVLVVISLRGGVDGMGVVVPHGDPAYYAARPTIGVPAASLFGADAMFGLHPALRPLEWLLATGELAAVHAVGMEVPNRSHFRAMEEIEDADPTSTVRRGWVNRMVGLGGGSEPYDAVGLGDPVTPTALVGDALSLTAESLADVSLAGADGDFLSRRRRQLRTTWKHAPGALGDATRAALRTADDLRAVVETPYRADSAYPKVYPAAGLAAALRDTARLIKADVGTEVVSVDYGTWDMHADYGVLDSGRMQSMLRGFAGAVDAFLRDLGPTRSRVTVVTISEFGRRVTQNGNNGLDHGWGNMMLLMGGGVRGGYHGSWPGLGTDKLVDGDLQVTTDYRNVLGEVVARRFPDRSPTSVFPGLAYRPIGVML